MAEDHDVPIDGDRRVADRRDTLHGVVERHRGSSSTGAPIEPDVAERLFDPFLTTGLDPRTGLELAMAFGVVRQSGGEIEVRRGAGGGSTIEIRLPEADPPRDPE